MNWMDYFIAGIITGLIGLLIWVVYADSQQPKFTLNKVEWTCTKTEPRTSLMLIGKVLIPTVTVECLEYKRK